MELLEKETLTCWRIDKKSIPNHVNYGFFMKIIT